MPGGLGIQRGDLLPAHVRVAQRLGLPTPGVEHTPRRRVQRRGQITLEQDPLPLLLLDRVGQRQDRKSTRLNSSHLGNLVCRLLLEKKKKKLTRYVITSNTNMIET